MIVVVAVAAALGLCTLHALLLLRATETP
jgi:hypothetical protein